MKRTPILLTAGALAALMTAGLLTGCGGSGKNGSSGDDNKLYVYNWGEYIDESVIDDFEKETGIQVVYDVFETNEEMYPVIEAGGVSYDVVCPSDYMIQKMIENNLLAEINFDNIPITKKSDRNIWISPKVLTRKTNIPFPTAGVPWESSTIRR